MNFTSFTVSASFFVRLPIIHYPFPKFSENMSLNLKRCEFLWASHSSISRSLAKFATAGDTICICGSASVSFARKEPSCFKRHSRSQCSLERNVKPQLIPCSYRDAWDKWTLSSPGIHIRVVIILWATYYFITEQNSFQTDLPANRSQNLRWVTAVSCWWISVASVWIYWRRYLQK